MSPSSSAAAMPSHVRNRGSSNATPVPDASIKPSRISSRPGSPAGLFQDPSVPVPNYTVFIRLPFNRGEFRDPAPTNWTAAKDRQLWKLISKSHSGDLDWEGLSQDFDVELNFLLMQAAWLSERHMERMRRQMTRVGGGGAGEGGAGSGTASSSGGVKMERTASRESKLQSGSTTTAGRRGSPSLPLSSEVPASPIIDEPKSGVPPISRTPSSATVTQSKVTGSRQQQPRSRGLRGSSGSTRKAPVAAAAADIVASSKHEHYENALEHEGRSDSDSGDEPPSALARSQAFRRPPPGKKAKSTLADLASEGDDDRDDDDDDDDDASSNGGYLPFAAASKPDPAATLRIGSPKRKTAQPAATSTTNTPATSSNPRSRPPREPPARSNTNPESSQSSTHSSSVAPGPAPSKVTRQPSQLSSAPSSSDNPSQQNHRRASYDSASPALRPAHPLSPRHRAQLASLSPRSRRDGSEGSPSMGSSFSDLDDTSVTQSALEEALLSNMRAQGGSTMASRMSSLRDALGRRGG
ncbi:hypothetical protein CKM354_000143900 [Cercospora kikuchii]|uniref:Autophagy-related protein 29 n=1 Tax=Cercospora kikuchii TaxID=84275 RepID=A0A9P3FBX1_9PEZI|nr:uncharacterized protein CKM354_000143900 [Cercospora kikuchii]GIZ38012.1 hypothetical protein CKM354_000143900 [Cercospora kikuchii]